MAGQRLLRILERLSATGGAQPSTADLCTLSVDLAGATGAGLMLMSDDLGNGSLCTSNEVSAQIEELQFTLGEGPCLDAHRAGRPVLEPDLADPGTPRWFAFTPPAVQLGARAVFGFPLRVGAARIGALALYRDAPGRLSDDEHADTLVMADVAAQAVLAIQANAPLGAIASDLERGAEFHLVVHQASGMVSAQLGVSVGEGLVRMRAHAFAHETTITEVAGSIVARRLRVA